MEGLEDRFSSKALEDFRLIDMAVGGDEKSYAKLMQRYRRPVYHVILKMVRNVDDAEDLTIENTYTDDNGESVSIDVEDSNLNPQEEAIKAQKEELIQIFVDKLPAKYQKLVRLRYFHELSYEEIAKELDAPLGTVKAQLHRARELMYELVKNKKEHI